MLDVAARHPDLARQLQAELAEVTTIFERELASEISAVNRLCLHIERYRGKMLRPTLVLLSGLAVPGRADGGLRESHRVIAAVVEMIHMATLVHDDVLDEASVRRRGATVNHLRGNETAVILGDYLISGAFHLCSTIGDPAVNLALGRVTNTLCEGELLQLDHQGDASLDEATYFEIVRRKTASLIAESCRLGAALSGADADLQAALHQAGMLLGIAFQIQDDLLDLYGDESRVGKSLGRDLGKRKLTLPVIRGLTGATPAIRAEALEAIERGDEVSLRRILDTAGAANAARATAQSLVAEARSALSTLEDGPVRALFLEMADAVVARDR
ncbi:MAG: polyprenyl synthetase family protein [Phycisphaeraceae bacterium]|nr:polyprenyl synthetase family protein [Phycisphaeraceae bacterium]